MLSYNHAHIPRTTAVTTPDPAPVAKARAVDEHYADLATVSAATAALTGLIGDE